MLPGEPGQDLGDQLTASCSGLVDNAPAIWRDRYQDRPTVVTRPMPPDQALAHEPVAHAQGRRGRHSQSPGEVDHTLRAARCEHHQAPVLATAAEAASPARAPAPPAEAARSATASLVTPSAIGLRRFAPPNLPLLPAVAAIPASVFDLRLPAFLA